MSERKGRATTGVRAGPLRPGTLLRIEALRSVMPRLSIRGRAVADFGGFDGELASRLLKSKVRRAVVLDQDPAGLEAASRKGLEAIRGSVTRAPFRARTFDTVLCLDVLEHVHEDSRAVREIARVLRPGGRVLLSVPAKEFGLPLVPRNWLNGYWGHVRNGYAADEVAEMCRKAGLRVVEVGRYFNFISRLAYSLLCLYRIPPLLPGIRLRLFRTVIRLEKSVRWRALELWLLAERV